MIWLAMLLQMLGCMRRVSSRYQRARVKHLCIMQVERIWIPLIKSVESCHHSCRLGFSWEGVGPQPVEIIADQRLQRSGLFPCGASVGVVLIQVIGVA